MTAEQFNHILDMEAAAGAATVVGGTAGAPAALPAEASGPPIIAINGGNPATIEVSTTYDNQASSTSPATNDNAPLPYLPRPERTQRSPLHKDCKVQPTTRGRDFGGLSKKSEDKDDLRRQLLGISRRGLGDLTASLVSRDVD